MSLLQTLTLTDLDNILTPSFDPVYDDFRVLCRGSQAAVSLLGCLYRWTRWLEQAESPEKRAKRDGWIRKSAKDLAAELDLSRHDYQTARAFLADLGVVSCRRENRVFGQMTWRINIDRLARLIMTKVQGRKLPQQGWSDRDGIILPDFVPADLWEQYQKSLYKRRKAFKAKDKQRWLEQLAALHERGLDLRPIMLKSIERGWFGFFPPKSEYPAADKQNDGTARMLDEYRKDQEEKRRQAEQPPPDKPPSDKTLALSLIDKMLQGLKHR